jgi:hypothetical protein
VQERVALRDLTADAEHGQRLSVKLGVERVDPVDGFAKQS